MKKPKNKRLTKKELEQRIEELEEFIADADNAWIDLSIYKEEYKKRCGKEYEY